MSDKKNIDTFFKEHLAHFEINPPEMAWENIEAKLNEKKEKRRVIPFWLKFSGIAAILLIGFGLYTTYFNNNSVVNHPIVNQQNTVPNHSKEKEVANSSSDKTINKEVVIQNQDKPKDKTDVIPLVVSTLNTLVPPAFFIAKAAVSETCTDNLPVEERTPVEVIVPLLNVTPEIDEEKDGEDQIEAPNPALPLV